MVITEANRTTIRFNEEVRRRALELISKYPEDYPNFSIIFRAGVIALHKSKINEADTNGFRTQNNREAFL